MKAYDIKEILEDQLGDWNDRASISEDEQTISITVENPHRDCGDDPYAYKYEFEIGGEFYCTGQGGNGRNWGTPYDGAGLDTLEKVRYACECATRHNWRHWGGN